MDDRRGASGDGDGHRRPVRHRERGVNPWLPEAEDLRALFLELGVDIRSEDSIQDWNLDREYAHEARLRRAWWRKLNQQVLAGTFVAIITTALGWVATWWNSRSAGH